MYILLFLAIIVIGFAVIVWLYMTGPSFGAIAKGERLQKMLASPNYKNGVFHNQHYTPALTEGYSMPGLIAEFLFTKKPHRIPIDAIPTIKTNLKSMPTKEDVLIWFGHSSYYLQVDGKKFLIDPVLSGNASPINTTHAFKGTDIYTVDELPAIDCLIITHDHFDHLDFKTVVPLRPKVQQVVCGLGVGAHLERWGYDAGRITELDWQETYKPFAGFTLTALPTRHFSGRTFKRNSTLWLSLMLQTQTLNIYIGGDSGYDDHFKKIGEQFPNIDLAILDNGQYDPKWKYIHMLPEEVVQAAKDLHTKKLLPFHSSKFPLGYHPWNEPLKRVTAANSNGIFQILTPRIGEPVRLKDDSQMFTKWWENLQ